MKNSVIVALRKEYDTLLRIADGLLDMIYSNDACNVLTFSRMAADARNAARHLASEIERLIFEARPAPAKKESKRTMREAIHGFFAKITDALLSKLEAVAA
jgi:hypothetical protein